MAKDNKAKNRTFPKEEEKKLRAKIRNLKSQNKKLLADVKKLKADKAQMEEALFNNFQQIKDLVKDIPLEDILQFSKQKKMGNIQ